MDRFETKRHATANTGGPRRRLLFALGASSLALLGLAPLTQQPEAQAQAKEIGVYSGRHYNTDKELYRQFEQRTGIRVKLLEGKDDALIERVRQEGKNTSADVLVLVDAARLDRATDLGLFQPTRSSTLQRDVPASLRDSQGRWYGLTRRVRAVIVNPKLVQPSQIRTYADLAKPSLRGKLCLRDNKSVYNQSLVADQLIQRGEAATRTWVRGMVANLKPNQPLFTSDTPLARAVAQGNCGVGVVNTYYVARMLSGESGSADQQLARQLRMVFPNPAHVNISGAGVTRWAKNPAAARQLIEFLASPTGGKGYAEANHEYPLKGYGGSRILNGWGPFKADNVSAEQMGARNKAAVALMQNNGWK
ncbi:MAG: extracellular solute-binding protein [Synechococcus sp.]|nr:extracellular solute-binding protein [Synechococcus sp.]